MYDSALIYEASPFSALAHYKRNRWDPYASHSAKRFPAPVSLRIPKSSAFFGGAISQTNATPGRKTPKSVFFGPSFFSVRCGVPMGLQNKVLIYEYLRGPAFWGIKFQKCKACRDKQKTPIVLCMIRIEVENRWPYMCALFYMSSSPCVILKRKTIHRGPPFATTPQSWKTEFFCFFL